MDKIFGGNEANYNDATMLMDAISLQVILIGLLNPPEKEGEKPGDITKKAMMDTDPKVEEGASNPKEVNIHGKINSELDEVDLINKVIYEDKSAKKLYMENPDFPQTESQWAYKQIYQKGSNRIKALQQTDFSVSSSVTNNLPDVEDLKGLKDYVFRIDADTPELRAAVQVELDNLKVAYPDYNFSATFGGNN